MDTKCPGEKAAFILELLEFNHECSSEQGFSKPHSLEGIAHVVGKWANEADGNFASVFHLENVNFRNRHHELATPNADASHLLADLLPQVPR
jgi:hypothetical protein